MFLLIFITIIVIICFHTFYWKRRNLPPGPLPLPFIGNIITLVKYRPGYEAFEKFRREYGDIYTYWAGDIPIIGIADYKLIQETFIKDGEAYAGRESFNHIPYLLRGGDYGVVFTMGEEWKEQRRFAMQILRNLGMGKNIVEQKILLEFDELYNDLITEIDNNDDKEVNISHYLEITVANIINQLLFGYGYHDKRDKDKFSKLKDILTQHMQIAISPRIQLISDYPSLRYVPFFKQAFDEFKYGYDMITNYCKDELIKHKKNFNEKNEPNDYIDAYLFEILKNKNKNFTEVQCINVAYDIWIAGQETTSNTLIFSVIYSLYNPDKLEKLHQELDNIIGSNRRITTADKSNLPYTNAYINEIQRLVNLLPQNLIHKTTKDVQINNYLIKKGTDIVPQISTILYDENIFPEPLKFIPERFLDNDGNLKKIDEFIPFSIGKRQCLGESLAKSELYLLLANFYNNFTVEFGTVKPSLNKKPGVTIQPEKFICIIKKRYN